MLVGASPREGRGHRHVERQVIGPSSRCASSEEELAVIVQWHEQLHDSHRQRPALRTDEVRLPGRRPVPRREAILWEAAAEQQGQRPVNVKPNEQEAARRQPGQENSTWNNQTTDRDTRSNPFGPSPRREAPKGQAPREGSTRRQR